MLIADEPTTALDVTTQLQILKLLKSLTQEFGIAMLFVTHDFGVVAQLCDATTVMYAGQTVETGPTAQVLADPRHPYTQALLACHPDRSQTLCRHSGSGALAVGAAAGLPVYAALPSRRRGLQPAPGPAGARRARPFRQLPSGRRTPRGEEGAAHA